MPPETDQTALPAIDPQWLETMSRTKPDFLVRLFTVFVREEPKRVGAMQEALAAADMPRLKHLAHSLKGAAATMGCVALSQCCLDLEKAALAGDLDLTRSLLDQADGRMTEVCDLMRTRLAEAGQPAD